MPGEIPSAGSIGGLIPNVWFDIFGRIIPGAFLICGMMNIFWSDPAVQWLRCFLSSSAVGPAIGFLLLLAAAHIVGSLMGHLSFWLVDNVFAAHWRVRLNQIPPRVLEIVGAHYGEGWDKGESDRSAVRKARDFCSYYIWNRNPALAVIFGRWDAEALGSRSTLVASLILLGAYWHTCGWHWTMLILGAIAVLSFFGFIYHQRRATTSRFDMVLVLNQAMAPPAA